MKFLGKGQCNIGIVQIVKRTVDYSGWYGEILQAVLNHGWKIDRTVPYPNPAVASHPTSDNPFSNGRLSMQDQPGNVPEVNGSTLLDLQLDFETCVVALPEGEEFELDFRTTSGGGERFLNKMAVYGCISWSVHASLDETTGQYIVTRTLNGNQTSDKNVTLTYAGAGFAPKDAFKWRIKGYYHQDYDD